MHPTRCKVGLSMVPFFFLIFGKGSNLWLLWHWVEIYLSTFFFFFPLQEFEESGDPEKHFQALLSLAKEGIEKGKVWTRRLNMFFRIVTNLLLLWREILRI